MTVRDNMILAEPCTLWPTAAVRVARAQSPAVEATTRAAMTPAAMVRVAVTGPFRSRLRGDLAAHRMRGWAISNSILPSLAADSCHAGRASDRSTPAHRDAARAAGSPGKALWSRFGCYRRAAVPAPARRHMHRRCSKAAFADREDRRLALFRRHRGKAAFADREDSRLALFRRHRGKAAFADRENSRLALLRRRRGKAASAGRADRRLALLHRRRGKAASAGRADRRLALFRRHRGKAASRAHPDRGTAAASDLATSRLRPRSWYCRGLPARPFRTAGRHLGGEVERSHARPALPIGRCHSCRESQTHGERR